MNQLLVKRSLDDLNAAFDNLSDEKNSREISIAKTKMEEAQMWLKKALEIEQVFE